MMNSDFLNGLDVKEATAVIIAKIKEKEIGYGKIQYRLRINILASKILG